ncbi:MAG: Na(+)/H(+) antiporter subunit D [Myxococcota bacterium]
MIADLPPALVLIVGALVVPLLRGRVRAAYVLLLPVASLAHFLTYPEGASWQVEVFTYPLTLVRIDALSRVFVIVFHIAAFIACLFSLGIRDPLQFTTSLMYAGSAIGAVLAGDLITLFVFWELLAVTSVFLIWARRTPRATAAGTRYLLVQVASGLALFAGVVLHLQQTGSVAFGELGLDGPATALIFAAFGVKCAFPLLHNWLTDAYPEATPTGAVFLSVFTTKVAIYALARGFPGTEWLIYIGAAMAAFPIFYAVIENDLRRVLAYSMINQLGFMVCGIGLGTELALNGTVSHVFNHVIYKGLLFMTMGAVLHRTGKINGSELGGLYKSMPVTTGFCIVAAASISAFPLFSGFVSKSMVMAAALEEGHDWIWLVLLFASAGVFHHAGIKIPYFAFFAHDSGIRCQEAPRNMLLAMGLAAALCIFNGCFPFAFLYKLMPYEVGYVPYTSAHVISQMQLLFFAALAFAWLNLVGLYPPELRSTNIDSDYVYRRAGPALVRGIARLGTRLTEELFRPLDRAYRGLLGEVMRHHTPPGLLGEPWSTGAAAMWAAILLGAYLLLAY